MKKVDTARIAEAYGYNPDEVHGFGLPMTGDTYCISWTERQAAEDIINQFRQHYGEEPKAVIVTTVTKYLI